MTPNNTLYGIPCSLYTAKARSYLRKQGLPFRELSVSASEYQSDVLPEIKRTIMPVWTTDTGRIIQDSADIIRFNEDQAASRYPALPDSARLRAISYLFELFGGEGLLRPAMHYRWNFDDVNLNYLRSEFRCLAPIDFDNESWPQMFDFASGRMRKAARSFGVSEQSASAIEASYANFLRLFEAHLQTHPYLLGGQPTLGDYALMGPLYAHLYRDPYPGQLLRRNAPLVARWVERMNTAEESWADYEGVAPELISDADIPESLLALMRFIADDFQPEILAQIEYTNQWLSERPNLASGTNGLDDPNQRYIGAVEFLWRGLSIKTSVLPYRFYLLQYLQDEYGQASDAEQKEIAALFEKCGLAPLLTTKTSRRVARIKHLEVWE